MATPCDSFEADDEVPTVCAVCFFTQAEHQGAPPPSPAPSAPVEPLTILAPTATQRPFPPVRSARPVPPPRSGTPTSVAGSTPTPAPRPVPAVPPKPQPPPKPAHSPLAASTGTPPPSGSVTPPPDQSAPLSPKAVPPPRPSAVKLEPPPKPGPKPRPKSVEPPPPSSPPPPPPEEDYSVSYGGEYEASETDDIFRELAAQQQTFDSPRMELDVASDADLEEAPPEHFGSMTAPSGSSSPTGNGFGSATFGASTFTATPKRDTRELKAFGAHRGQSPGRTSAEVPASKNPTMQGNDGREPSPTAQRPTLTRAQTLADLPAHDDQAAVVSYEEGDPTSPSPRSGKTGMFKGKLDPFAIMKKKGKRESNTPDVPKSDKPEKSSGGIFGFQALSKITGAMSPKGRGDKREKSSEMEPSEERKRKEDQFWTRIEALKSDRKPQQRTKLRRLSREVQGPRRAFNQGESDAGPATKVEPTPSAELDKKREYIVREIFSTETTYVKNLSDCITTYYKPMLEATKTQKEIPADLINAIFSNMEVILPLNRDHLLKELNVRMENWSAEQLIGDIFVRFGPFLKMYTKYNDGFDGAMKALELAALQPWFLQFCNAKVLIESLLINPVQRIPRYTLLLEDLWKNTPSSHPDNDNLLKAIQFMKKVAAHVNLSVAKNQNFDKLTSEGLEHLLAAHRILVIDGEMQVSKMVEFRKKKGERPGKLTLKILVFNDILVFFDRALTEKKEIKKREESWPLEAVWLEREPGSNDSFNLIGPTRRFLVHCLQPEVYERWWQAVLGAIDKQLEATQAHLKGTRFTGCAETLDVRKLNFIFKSGLVYQGWWEKGHFHGKGSTDFQGAIYDGDFEQDRRHGSGTLQYPDGHVYTGDFRNNLQNGRGVLISREGDRYEGEWFQGKKHGMGEAIFCSGDKYVGEFKEDFFDGVGALSTTSGLSYLGLFQRGLFHGDGVLTTAEGIYSGQFFNGVRNGNGSMKWIGSGASYEGNWKNGAQQGFGVMVDHQGTYEGEWFNGRKKGKGKFTYNNGAVYDGMWEDDARHGKGTLDDPSGYARSYKGEWHDDLPQGRGTIQFANGSVYEGNLHEGLPQSHGTLTSMADDGSRVIVDSRWNRGVREAKCTVTIEDAEGNSQSYPVDDEDEWGDLPVPNYLPPVSWYH